MTAVRVERALAFSNYGEKVRDVYAPVRDALRADLEAMRLREGLDRGPMHYSRQGTQAESPVRSAPCERRLPGCAGGVQGRAVIVEARPRFEAVRLPVREIEL